MAGPTGNSCHLFCHFVEFTYCHCVEDTEVECRRGRANIFVWGFKQKLEGRASSTRMLWYVPIKISPSIYTHHKNDEDRFTDVGDSQSVKRSSPCAVQKLRNQRHHQYHGDDDDDIMRMIFNIFMRMGDYRWTGDYWLQTCLRCHEDIFVAVWTNLTLILVPHCWENWTLIFHLS